MSLVSSWLCGMCNGFTVLPRSVPGIYTQPRVRVSQSVCGHRPESRGSLNSLSTVPRWQKQWMQAKWSMALQSRGQVPKSPVPSPPPPPIAKPRLLSQPRVPPPCRPEPRRCLRPRWKAFSIGSTSGRPTIRKPRAGNSSKG